MNIDDKILELIQEKPMTSTEIYSVINSIVETNRARIDVRLSYLRRWNLVEYKKIISKKQGRNPLIYVISEKGKTVIHM